MNTNEKKQIVELIRSEKARHGSFNRLSRVCNVSNATISNMVNGKWESISDEIWGIVSSKVGLTKDRWIIAETFNVKQMFSVIDTSRTTRSFWAVSCKAGSGKTASIKHYASVNRKGVYVIQSQEWTQRQFMQALTRELGIEPKTGYNSIAMMLEQVVDFFRKRLSENPVLIIDEADKLKDGAKRMIIPLFNQLEDQLACVIAGTENLEQEIKRGARNAKKGFDEIDSRFGRTYFKLTGATFKDVEAICIANGITAADTIKSIFNRSNPRSTAMRGVSVKIVEDMRPVKNLIRAEKIMKPELDFETV